MLNIEEFYEIFIDALLAESEERDPEGLAPQGAANFIDIDSPHASLEDAELHIDTTALSTTQASGYMIIELNEAGVIAYGYNNPLAGL